MIPGVYKEKWACFHCRKCFKHANRTQRSDAPPLPRAADGSVFVRCPQCRGQMHNMGVEFKVPRQNDVKQWKKVALLFARGYDYAPSPYAANNLGPRPTRLQDVPAFLRAQEHALLEQQRQQRIRERAAELQAKRRKQRKQLEARRLRRAGTDCPDA